MKRIRRTPLAQLDAWDDDGRGDDEAEEVDEIDTANNEEQQQEQLHILNSIPVKKPRGRAPKEEDTSEPVFLDQHFTKVYNRYMETRFQYSHDSSSSSSNNEDDLEDEEDMTTTRLSSTEDIPPLPLPEECDDLFASFLGGSRSTSPSSSSSSPVSSTPAKKRKKKKSSKHKKKKQYDTRVRGECFLCGWGNKFHDGIKAKHVNILCKIMDNYGGASNEEIAQQLHLYFKKNIYDKESEMEMLTKEVALEHIEGLHSLSAIVFVGESVRAWKKVLFGFQNLIFKENGKYDKDAFDRFEKCQKMLCMLYRMKIQDLGFNFGKSNEDTHKMGQLFTFMPQFKQKKEHAERVKETQKRIQAAPLLATDNGFDI